MSNSRPSQIKGESLDAVLPWILRLGVAACFLGHGMLGVMQTTAWTSYFNVLGVGRDTALHLMPVIGAFDVAMALLVLIRPVRGVVLYMVIWCVWTALLRPLAGESFWEAIERAGNYGAPFALFLLMRDDGVNPWLGSSFRDFLDERQTRMLAWVLRLSTVLLLLGHGALGLIVRKPVFSTQYSVLGLPGAGIEPYIGGFEWVLALAVLFKSDRRLLFGVVAWKLTTEALAPMAGSPIWVFIEHGGSYAAPLALAFLCAKSRSPIVNVAAIPAT
ncbi:MAG TPA: hypothetical protein VGM64_02200 [Lacunisphaera sp.]|jgi:TRAP-type C4-dicarboxylate transport system permease small subunit